MERERKFVVSFYMADQTLSVYEPVLPNSGLQGGKFLERARVYKNGGKLVRVTGWGWWDGWDRWMGGGGWGLVGRVGVYSAVRWLPVPCEPVTLDPAHRQPPH